MIKNISKKYNNDRKYFNFLSCIFGREEGGVKIIKKCDLNKFTIMLLSRKENIEKIAVTISKIINFM